MVDASVAGKWFLRDEDHTHQADQLLLDYQERRVSLIAPDYLRYEVPSLICKAVGGKRITPEDARNLIGLFGVLELRTVRTRKLVEGALEMGLRYSCTFYDGLYLALAEAIGCRMVHADAKLRRTLKGRFPLELWIEDYWSP
ncbi:MAG: type II toxin-antitoxin system VapC family toxin [Chloroflexi bacterium]|nr:type II toxin-antitoxin system VapC family toxin [Chloroflexota bacterium]